jgi:hypothetical protein
MNTLQSATKREAIFFAIKAMVDANPDVVINRLTEIAMKYDVSGIMLDILLKGLAVDATVTDGDLFRTKVSDVLDIDPNINEDNSVNLDGDQIDINIKYECGNDAMTGDIVHCYKKHRIRQEDAKDWGITVFYI